jgi:hypothetical protein
LQLVLPSFIFRSKFCLFCNKLCFDLLLQISVCIFSIYLCMLYAPNIFGANVLKPRFKIDVVIMIICSIVIIINSVLTLQVSTSKYPMIADLAK